MVYKDHGYHEIDNHDGDNHGIVLVDRIDASKVSIYECCGMETTMYVDAVDVDIPDDVEMALLRSTRQPSIGKSTRNGVDYTFDLLGELFFLFLLRLLFVSLLVMPLSSSLSLLLS